ncbi:MAG: Phosphoglycerate dehydrogenase [Chloroflexi bacterium]|nr:MAG: Phosphoglycerate dehydrogenase [Chloroflexota bacterium]
MHVLIITGLTLSEVPADHLARIESALEPHGVVTIATTREEALAAAPQADVILGFVDPELFALCERLRWVHAIASGVDAFMFPEFLASDVVLTGEKGLVGGHLADHAFALLLAITRRLAAAVRLGPAAWEQRAAFRREEIELEGATMGIVGFGGTGREVAKRAAAFGMRCRAVDREAVQGTPDAPLVNPMARLPQMLAQSDVVAICCPLTKETRNLFNDDAFAQMKPGAILINVTRGEIVDGDALARAIESGAIAGAGLDVAPQEPLPAEHPLWGLETVVMTPHTAGASQLRTGRNLDRFTENLRRFQRDRPLIGLVDKTLGY